MPEEVSHDHHAPCKFIHSIYEIQSFFLSPHFASIKQDGNNEGLVQSILDSKPDDAAAQNPKRMAIAAVAVVILMQISSVQLPFFWKWWLPSTLDTIHFF